MMKRNASNPIWPFPMCSCRSTREPRAVFESFRCNATSRSSPIMRSNSANIRFVSFSVRQIVTGRKNVRGIEANAEPLGLADIRDDMGKMLEAMAEA